MPRSNPTRPRRTPARWIAVWLLACPLIAAAAGVIDEDENALIASLRDEASRYGTGNGDDKDGDRAAALYCKAARLGDAESQFRLGWIYTNGIAVPRNDTLAAFFFQIAAEQGIEQATRMLGMVGGPTQDVPACMRDPVPGDTALAAARARPGTARRIAAPPDILNLVQRMAPEYRVETQLALAIIEAESNFNTVALSPKNAKGLMQLIPETAARFHVRNPYDPAQNIRGGLAYLRWLLAYFEGDVRLVAAAYNAGEGAVERYRGVPPYLETRAYVRRIVQAMGSPAHPFDASVTAPSPQLALIRPQRLVR
ncbi:MAG: transglycosylase SLT domain-containing protein [Rhizobacter sp.]